MAAKKKTTNGNLSAALKTHGWPPALPALLLTSQGEILESNARMDALLGPAREWPFFNEHDSKQALFKLVRQTDREELFPGEAGLKTYRIHVRPTGAGRRLVVAEMMRSGDPHLGPRAPRIPGYVGWRQARSGGAHEDLGRSS